MHNRRDRRVMTQPHVETDEVPAAPLRRQRPRQPHTLPQIIRRREPIIRRRPHVHVQPLKQALRQPAPLLLQPLRRNPRHRPRRLMHRPQRRPQRMIEHPSSTSAPDHQTSSGSPPSTPPPSATPSTTHPTTPAAQASTAIAPTRHTSGSTDAAPTRSERPPPTSPAPHPPRERHPIRAHVNRPRQLRRPRPIPLNRIQQQPGLIPVRRRRVHARPPRRLRQPDRQVHPREIIGLRAAPRSRDRPIRRPSLIQDRFRVVELERLGRLARTGVRPPAPATPSDRAPRSRPGPARPQSLPAPASQRQHRINLGDPARLNLRLAKHRFRAIGPPFEFLHDPEHRRRRRHGQRRPSGRARPSPSPSWRACRPGSPAAGGRGAGSPPQARGRGAPEAAAAVAPTTRRSSTPRDSRSGTPSTGGSRRGRHAGSAWRPRRPQARPQPADVSPGCLTPRAFAYRRGISAPEQDGPRDRPASPAAVANQTPTPDDRGPVSIERPGDQSSVGQARRLGAASGSPCHRRSSALPRSRPGRRRRGARARRRAPRRMRT